MSKKSKCELEILERIATRESRIASLHDERNAIQQTINAEEATLKVLVEVRDSVNVKSEDKNE